MTKKEIIDSNQRIGYASAFGGIEIHFIEYGIDDYVYFTAGAWVGRKSYHKSKVYYGGKNPYFKYKGIRVNFNNVLRG